MIMLLHAHHDNENGCPISLLISAEERAQNIVDLKPPNEVERRLAHLRVITPAMLPAKAQKAWDAHNKAQKAWEACDEAWKACNETEKARIEAWGVYGKAWEAFFAGLTPEEWEAWHKTVCLQPSCKWTAEHPSIF